MNMAVEHSHRTEALELGQRLLRVVGAPTPILGYRPQRDVSEDDDRSGGGKPPHIVGEPDELLGPENAEAAGLQVHHIDQTDEMDAVLVEGIPARALGVLAVALEIGLARLLVEDVVLARHVVHVETRGADDLRGIVELGRGRQMGDVTRMKHEGRLAGERFDLGDGLLQRAERVRIRGLVEAHMAVGDLQEAE